MKDIRITEGGVLKLLQGLNISKARGPDEISPKILKELTIKVITKLPNSEQSYKGKVQTHNYINRQNQSTTGKL